MNATLNVLGVMSGSSLDGFDLALCSFESNDWSLLASHFSPIKSELKSKLGLGINQDARAFIELDHMVSNAFVEAIKSFQDKHSMTIDLIAIHGHTMIHEPQNGLTKQLGNGGYIASKTGIAVAADFRIQDIAQGGVGTPLVPIAERTLFTGKQHYLNLGGIANISHNNNGKWEAYDVCPCNQVLNYFAEKEGMPYDKNGVIAAKGLVHQPRLQQWLQLEYLDKAPPKSLDNNWIKQQWIPELETADLSNEVSLCTYVHFIATAIAKCLEAYPAEDQVFVTGGGAYNDFLIESIKSYVQQELVIADAQIIDYKEAILMSYLGYLRFNEQINILNEVTGAKQELSAGAIYLAPI